MRKFCIFCGGKPESKNREHVIPQWLIKLTGEPKRIVNLGMMWPNIDKLRKYSFNSYVFPSCENCNGEFSDLEMRAKAVVESILAKAALSMEQWDTFLDWLDKVRTGLWLAGIYLNKGWLNINPKFYIKQRVGSKDRLLIIYEIANGRKLGLNWHAVDTPLFEHMPSCFALTINNFLFFNVSNGFLLARHLGFPYPVDHQFLDDGREVCSIGDGTHVLQLPRFDNRFAYGGTQLFQPMIPSKSMLFDYEQDVFEKLYGQKYVRGNCMDFEKGKGNIFLCNQQDTLVKYPTTASCDWLPQQKFHVREVMYRATIMALRMLETLYCRHANAKIDQLDPEKANRIMAERDSVIQANRAILENLKRQKNKWVRP